MERALKSRIPTYAGSACLPAAADGEVDGRIAVEPHGLSFHSETIRIQLSLDRLNLVRDDSGRLQFSSPDETDWVIYAADEEILRNYFLTRRNRLRLQVREIRREQEGRRTVKLAGIFLLGFAAVAAAVWLISGWTIDFLVRQIPVSWEVQLADATYEEIKAHLKPVDEPGLTAELRALTDRIVAVVPNHNYHFQLEIIDAPAPNAFALPGGRILVTTGVFKATQRPEEVAGVLAHEIAHVIKRHGLRKVIVTAGPYYLLKLFVSDKRGFLSVISNGSQLLVRQSFSRDLERDADETGWHYLEAARIDPRGLAEFLRRLMSDKWVQAVETSPLRILSSHPPTPERVEHLDELWDRSKRKSGFVDLQSAVPPPQE